MGKAGFDEDALIEISRLQLDNQSSDPVTPVLGQFQTYAKNKLLFTKDADGTVKRQTGTINITANDTTPDLVTTKILAGTGITFTTLNPGANEQLNVAVSTIVGTSRSAVAFGKTGAAQTTFLECFRAIGSNDAPLVVPEASTLKAASVNVKTAGNFTFSIRKNGTEVATLSTVSSDKASRNDLSVVFAVNDEVSIFVSVGNPSDVVMFVWLRADL